MMKSCQSRCPVKLLLFLILQALISLVDAATVQICAAVDKANHGVPLHVRRDSKADFSLYVWDVGDQALPGYPGVADMLPSAVRLSNADPAIAKVTVRDADPGLGNKSAYHQLEEQMEHKEPEGEPFEKVDMVPGVRNLTNEVSIDGQPDVCRQRLEMIDWSNSESASKSVRIFKIEVSGVFIGRTSVQIDFEKGFELVSEKSHQKDPQSRPPLRQSLAVTLSKRDAYLNHMFIGILCILLIIANVLMGFKIDTSTIWSVVKRPVAPAIGIACQYVFMPMFALGLGMALFYGDDAALALGLFVTGCSPGGGASNFWTILLDGNVDLSIAMTFISTTAALLVLPAWMFLLGQRVLLAGTEGSHIVIPYRNIVISLSIIVFPLLLGTFLKRKTPRIAVCGLKILRPFLILIILFICTFGTYANLYMFQLMTWRVLLGGLSLPWAGFAFGLTLAVLVRQPTPNTVAIAIETGVQNTGVAIMLLKLSFPPPDGDLSAVIPVVVAIFTPVPLLTAVGVHYLRRYLCSGREKSAELEQMDVEKEKGSNGAITAAVVCGGKDANEDLLADKKEVDLRAIDEVSMYLKRQISEDV